MTIDESAFAVDFAFVSEPKIRQTLEQFHGEAIKAFKTEAYVATVVLSGAVMEGVLTYALTAREAEAKEEFRAKFAGKAAERPSPADWYLSELIQVASGLGLIGETARQGAWAVKDFRNLIHPYKLLARSAPRWQALALGALAAIADICPSISGRLGIRAHNQP